MWTLKFRGPISCGLRIALLTIVALASRSVRSEGAFRAVLAEGQLESAGHDRASATQSSTIKNSATKDSKTPDSAADRGYVGSKTCSQCHAQIYDQFSRTDMGRSISPVTPAFLENVPVPASVNGTSPNRHLEVFVKDDKLYQSEYETGADGKEIFRDTRELEWIIGAGANGFGTITRKGDELFQGPLSFYSKPQKWGLSPGYEFADLGFNRPILSGCIVCHSGRPKLLTGGNGRFEDPPFAEPAIGCENCHGPGLSHVATMQMNPNYEGHDPSIVNPSRLTPALADNICMNCHQMGDTRVLQPDKDFQDFRPGAPLSDTLAILLAPPKPDSPPQSDLLEHYYSMTLSKCYRGSAGKLNCITCHDPHVQPARAEAPAYFAKKCMACHTENSCSLPLAVRQHHDPPDDCAGCHMPKRDVQVISHSSLTNHRIPTRPDEPFPDFAFHQTTAALPDLIHLDPAPGGKDVPLPRVTLLQAYGELMEQKPEYAGPYATVLSELERTEPNTAIVQAALGHRDLHAGNLTEAVTHLQKALDLGHPQASTYADLADALTKMERPAEAVPALQEAIRLEPYNPTLQKTLVVRLIQLKRYPEAAKAMESYVEQFPQDSFMRQMLGRAQASGTPK